MDIIELIGWLGAVMLLIAYSANLLGRVSNDSRWFLASNIIGSGMLVINAYMNDAFPFVVVNLFWFLISIVQLIFTFRTKDVIA